MVIATGCFFISSECGLWLLEKKCERIVVGIARGRCLRRVPLVGLERFRYLPSWIAYGGFSIAKIRRQRDFYNYNRKKEALLEQRKLNDAESVNLQVQISPLLNPLDGRYGAVLAFSF